MPNRFVPINPDTPMNGVIAAMNNNFAQIDSENVVKTFKQANGNAIVQGRLPYSGGYGALYYDPNGIPSIVIGILPDGTVGIVAAKSGENVLDALA
jgi:hypothetical protein